MGSKGVGVIRATTRKSRVVYIFALRRSYKPPLCPGSAVLTAQSPPSSWTCTLWSLGFLGPSGAASAAPSPGGASAAATVFRRREAAAADTASRALGRILRFTEALRAPGEATYC